MSVKNDISTSRTDSDHCGPRVSKTCIYIQQADKCEAKRCVCDNEKLMRIEVSCVLSE
jgi:hypothetical protein